MPGQRGAVAPPEHGMHMDAWLAVRADRDIADQGSDFDLLFGASRLNLRIVDLAVRYHERRYGETNISRFRHGWLLLRMSLFAARKLKFV